MSINRTVAPAITDPVAFDYNLPPISTDTLDNGVPLYWLSAGVQDVAELNWVFPAGIWQESKAAVAQATAGLLRNGTITQDARQLNEALEFYGASLRVQAGNDHATVVLHCLSRHLPVLLPVVQDIICNAVFPERELDLYCQNTIQRLQVSLRECEFVANQRIDAVLFGAEHPYGRFSEKEKIEALTVTDLRDFHRQQYRLTDARIFMAGKVSTADVALINRYFGQTTADTAAAVPEAAGTIDLAPLREHISNDPDGVQAAIRVGRRFITRNHPDFAGMVVLNTVLGGYFGSRLMSNIREEKGYTYGIYSSVGAYQHDASLIIHTEVGRDVAEDAVKEIYKEMELLRTELIGEEELLLVKNYLLGNILGDLDGPFSILQRWRGLILNDFGLERFHSNIRTYKDITAAELQALAVRYFNAEDFSQIVVI
jgi:zinc protease